MEDNIENLQNEIDEIKKMQDMLRPFMKIMATNGDKFAEVSLLVDEVFENIQKIQTKLTEEENEEKQEKYVDFFKQLYLETNNFVKETEDE